MPDQEMIDRVAEGIYNERRKHYEDRAKFIELFPSAKEVYLNEARATIKAMREPTEKMLIAGSKIDTETLERDTWEAMIDSILND